MVKRICSLVLLFSCFCSLSLLLVAHAEDSDGLDFLPPDYEGTDLPGLESSGISTFAVGGPTQTIWSLWTVQSASSLKNVPQPFRVDATTSSNHDSTYILNLTDIPAHSLTLSTEPKDFMSSEYVHCMSYTYLTFSSLASSFKSSGALMYSNFAAMSDSMPKGSVDGWTRGYSLSSGRFSVTSPPDSSGNFFIRPGSSFYIPSNTKIKLRVSFNGSGGFGSDAFVGFANSKPFTKHSISSGPNYLETVISLSSGSWVGGSNSAAFYISGVSPTSDGTLQVIGFEVSLYDSSSDDVIGAINNQTEQLDQSITDAGKGVEDKIESSFDTSASSEIGSDVQDFADQASSSLGVVSYVDTIFSGLSGLVVSGSTTLTFPSVTIDVEGSSYQLWPDYTFDLSELDGWLSGLMAVVRLATSAVVVGAVISYLQHVYKEVIG